jgi:hypothetical protein
MPVIGHAGYDKPMFIPGNKALVSPQNESLIAALLEVRDRFGDNITPQERAILMMSVDLLDYMWDYANGPTNEEFWAMSEDHRNKLRYERRQPRGPGFTVEEFDEQILCSGGA